MNTQEIIKNIMDEMTPVEYPDLYDRSQVEDAIRQALKFNEKEVKRLEKRVSDAGWQYEYDHADDWRKITEMGQL